MIKGREGLQRAYQDAGVAHAYVARRFRSPLGALLHARQARAIRRVIRRQGITRAVELAPGPARLTVDTAPILDRVTLIDASSEMLVEARRRLDARGLSGRLHYVRADAFRLPLRSTVECVYSFRLIRHFERTDRVRLYRQIGGILRPGGWLLFDAVNAETSAPLRARAQPGEYAHFDALTSPDELRDELQEAGFHLVSLHGVQHHIGTLNACQIYVAPRSRLLARVLMEVVDRLGGAPLEWVVVCRRA